MNDDPVSFERERDFVLDWCKKNRMKASQPRPDQIKVGKWNFYPSTGTFNCDNSKKAKERGAEAFVDQLQAEIDARGMRISYLMPKTG